ncbi:helix-turn-helix domain-containing protein [Streptomyces incanus]|uniref:Helix-turn-helix domain-containing protein n=1 Tax=Streptomyces incanus TaxID=887453 RepID=A0ABW0XV94_9ACTN
MSRPGPRLAPLDLTADERSVLQGWVRRRRSTQDMVMRARGILACDEAGENGFPVSRGGVMERVGVSATPSRRWRRRFLADRLDGLSDEPRPGRPRTVRGQQVADPIARTLETKPENATHQSTRRTCTCVSRRKRCVIPWTTKAQATAPSERPAPSRSNLSSGPPERTPGPTPTHPRTRPVGRGNSAGRGAGRRAKSPCAPPRRRRPSPLPAFLWRPYRSAQRAPPPEWTRRQTCPAGAR